MDIPYQRWYNAIEYRECRRKYREKALNADKVEILNNLAKKLNNHYPQARINVCQEGFQEIRKKIIGTYGLVSGAISYAAIIGKTDKKHYQIEAGLTGEALVLEATALEINSCWVGGSFKAKQVKKQIDLQKNEDILAVIPLGYSEEKEAFSEKIMKALLKSNHRLPLDQLIINNRPDNCPTWITKALEAARLAPSTANLQPWRFKVKKNQITLISAEKKERHHVSPYLDCGIALLHLLLAVGIEGIDIELEYLQQPEIARLTEKY